jgi:hypothetical protein
MQTRKFLFNAWETESETILDNSALSFNSFDDALRFAKEFSKITGMSGYFLNQEPRENEPAGYDAGSDTYIQKTKYRVAINEWQGDLVDEDSTPLVFDSYEEAKRCAEKFLKAKDIRNFEIFEA